MTRIVLFLFLGSSFICCSKDIKLPYYELTLSKSIDIIGDTLLFKDIKCLTYLENKVLFTNPVYDHIVSLDNDLNFEKTIGIKGKGAYELLNIYCFAIDDTLICVFNTSNRRINIFSTNGQIVDEMPLSNDFLFRPDFRYCFNGNEIIGYSDIVEAPLSKYNIYTREQTLFGTGYNFSNQSPLHLSMRNVRYTAQIDQGFIVVSNNLPYIEIYDKDNLEQIVQYDFSVIDHVKRIIKYGERNPLQSMNSFRNLCEDIYLTDKHLYLLIYFHSDDYVSSNQILKFEIYPEITPLSIYELPGRWFRSFCVNEEEGIVYAYNNTENTIGAYLIPKK